MSVLSMKVILKHETNEQKNHKQKHANKINIQNSHQNKQTTIPKSRFFKLFPEKNFPKCSGYNVQV